MLKKLTGLALATLLSAGFGAATAQAASPQAAGAAGLTIKPQATDGGAEVIQARYCDQYGCRDGAIIYHEGDVRNQPGGQRIYDEVTRGQSTGSHRADREERRWRDERRWRERERRNQRRWEYRVQPRYDYRYAEPRYVQPRRVQRYPQAHYRWCQARYRSYRAWDNTFQPYNGPRRQCISPYI